MTVSMADNNGKSLKVKTVVLQVSGSYKSQFSLSKFTSIFGEGAKKPYAGGKVGITFPKGKRTKTLEKWTESSGKDVFCSLKISSEKDSEKDLI